MPQAEAPSTFRHSPHNAWTESPMRVDALQVHSAEAMRGTEIWSQGQGLLGYYRWLRRAGAARPVMSEPMAVLHHGYPAKERYGDARLRVAKTTGPHPPEPQKTSHKRNYITYKRLGNFLKGQLLAVSISRCPPRPWRARGQWSPSPD
ncbi:hypothetical protein FDECE_6994 [Fusarium decemcellulare]|nr:hypothetical protein FDECE_6994 [Fusarium decemcellulare]